MKKSNSMNVRADELESFSPLTANQAAAYEAWQAGKNLVLSGSAGTGKTFLGLYFAFSEMLKDPLKYHQVMIIRSMVSTRETGHLPGTKEEKEEPYKLPYKKLCDQIFGYDGAYMKLSTTNKLKFETTSYIRGATFDQTILVVDEMQNMNFHELDSVITRVGNDCRIIFAGDYKQTDFKNQDEKNGILQFISIIELMSSFNVTQFEWADIVRSDFVRDYIMTKEYLGY